MFILIILLVGCTKKIEYIEFNNETYQLIDTLDNGAMLLYKESNIEDKSDIVVFPVYEDVTCFSESSKIYQSYSIVYEDIEYPILQAIETGLLDATYFTNHNISGFDCVSHEYVNDNIVYDLVYQGEDFEIVVERCYEGYQEGESITIYEDQLLFISTSDAIYSKYKVIYQGEYFSLSSAMSLHIISKLELLDTQISDFWFTETNCFSEHEFCNSGSLENVYVYLDKVYQVTFQNEVYRIMKNIQEPSIYTDDIRSVGNGSCVVGSSTNLLQYIVLYENDFYSFEDFLTLNVVGIQEIIENGGTPCLDLDINIEED